MCEGQKYQKRNDDKGINNWVSVEHCGGVCVCVCEKDEGCAQVVGSSEREAVTCNHFLPLPSPGICRLTMPLSVFRLIQVNR